MKKKIKKINYRHGDVLLVPIKKIPTEAKKRDQEKSVLALGEVTGHSHQMSEGETAMFDFDDKVYLEVQSEIAALTHEEHHKIELRSGAFEVIIQREYEPNGWRAVRD